MHVFTVKAYGSGSLNDGESSFQRYFCAFFDELKDCAFIVDNWQPGNMHPLKQELLDRHRVVSLNVGRRQIHVHQGKRFLSSFGFAIPDGFGSVFAFTRIPDEAQARSLVSDGYHLDRGKLASQALASFLAFEGAWTFATREPRLVEALRLSLWTGVSLEETPDSLRKLIGIT